jgi:multiple sugar transport system permease protein
MQNSSSVSDAPAQPHPVIKRVAHDARVQRSRKPKWGFIKTIVLVAVALYVVILIVPLFLSFLYSFTDLNPLFPNTKFIGLQNYADMLSDADFLSALGRTISLSLDVTLAANVLGLFVAIMLNRPSRFYAILRTLFFIPQVLSGVIVGFIWGVILTTNNGILNIVLKQIGITAQNIAWLGKPNLAFLALTVVIIWQQMGFCVVVYLAALQGIPQDLVEAATIDGANRWNIFTNVTFPLLAPGVTVNVVLLLIISLKIYDQVVVLTAGGPGGQTETLAYYIVRITFTSNEAGYGSAVALVLFFLIAIISVILTSFLRKREVEL